MTAMSLLTLLLGILTTLFSLPGCPQAETAATALPARELVLEPQCDRELTGREEERMLAAVKYRCELVGLRGVQVRREGRNYLLRVNSGLIQSMEEYTDTLDELESVLNERTNLQLLRVHPDSSVLVRDAEVQTLLGRYESAMVAYEENHNPDEVPPQVPELPERLGVPAYMLVEQQVFSQEDGSSYFEYLVVQRPASAAEESLLITEQDVELAEHDTIRKSLSVTFTQSGSETLTRLTRSMSLGTDRLAILLNGAVVSAPVVHAELGCSCMITGLSPELCESVADGLTMPLPVPVRITARRSAE